MTDLTPLERVRYQTSVLTGALTNMVPADLMSGAAIHSALNQTVDAILLQSHPDGLTVRPLNPSLAEQSAKATARAIDELSRQKPQ